MIPKGVCQGIALSFSKRDNGSMNGYETPKNDTQNEGAINLVIKGLEDVVEVLEGVDKNPDLKVHIPDIIKDAQQGDPTAIDQLKNLFPRTSGRITPK